MGKHKSRTPFLPYEGTKENDKHIRITHDMLVSEQFLNLSNSAKVLYMFLKDWACGKKQFEYSQSLSLKIMSCATFWSCIDELERSGFIEIVRRGRLTGKTNTYKFSSKWAKKTI